MSKIKIGFAGGGWGALAAIKSLIINFDLEYLGRDEKIINLLSHDNHVKIDNFEEFQSRVIVCAGYMPIIQKEHVEKHQIINIHYSLLPKYRGLHSTAWAIMNGEKELGLTIHRMNEYIDDGDIIFQKSFVNDGVSSATYYMELMNEYISRQLGEIISDFIKGKIKPIKQNKLNASWVGKRSKNHNILDFTKSSVYIKRLFRILTSPYPLPHVIYKNTIYKVLDIKFHNSDITTDVSRILNIDKEGIWVKNKDGYIVIKNIVTEDNNPVKYTNFKIGHYFND